MRCFRTCFLFLLALVCPACNREAVEPEDDHSPLTIAFKPFRESLSAEDSSKRSCGLPPGRQSVYEPATGIFHIHFKSKDLARSEFEVTKVNGRFTKPAVFRLTGVPEGFGCVGTPLTLSVDGKDYALTEVPARLEPLDSALVRSERRGDVLTVAFTDKGQALLKPGAQIWFSIDTGW